MTDNEIGQIRLIGERNDHAAYEIRDFFERSVVKFEWIELASDDDCRRVLDIENLSNADLPVVEMSDGTRLCAPSLRDVARKLGFVTEPRRSEYDLSIYGAGPAGLSAAVYAASEGLSVVLVERGAVGGQAGTTSMIENYLGFPDGIAGADLAERARQQALKFGVEILMMREGIKARFEDGKIVADLAGGDQMIARSNICATGVDWRRIGLDREGDFLGRGIYYGAGVSEAPLCVDEDVCIVGGGNSAGQAVMHLADHAKSVTMLVRGEALAASMSDYLIGRIENAGNVTVKYNSEIVGLDGDTSLSKIRVAEKDKSEVWRDTKRLFVAIGGVPHTEWAKDTPIVRDERDYMVTGPDLMKDGAWPEAWPLERAPHFLETSVPGSFAAGDVRHRSIKRVATAAGEGAMAVAFVHRYLQDAG
ncbi:FAD-dependent oxidoreductase [uncultured Roseobacter sp.]|uniref:NAD(P)/FAD-dependent oxidoreductase n=1 Tax=uncultured Roseobacter sp. TaxID=114847 RepID=UPI00261EF62E|nr:FAD-dependent oxidoreductase [uncultured Roseobacter sp.]